MTSPQESAVDERLSTVPGQTYSSLRPSRPDEGLFHFLPRLDDDFLKDASGRRVTPQPATITDHVHRRPYLSRLGAERQQTRASRPRTQELTLQRFQAASLHSHSLLSFPDNSSANAERAMGCRMLVP